MRKDSIQSPPRLFMRFFRWYCHPEMQDYIEGDLLEVYERRIKKSGKRKADILFIIDVLLLFRPGIIRPAEVYIHVNNYTMFRSYFKIGWRNLARNKAYSIINIAGLALSMTCGILIFTFVTHHLSFDNFHQDSNRIYRIVTELHRDVVAYRNCVPSPLGESFRSDYTFGEKVARIYTERDVLITLKEKDKVLKYNETDGLAFTEKTFFEIFNFPLLKGDQRSVLVDPNTAVITETIARKYFGDEDPIGKTFWLGNKFPFTVTGILKDFPENTDLKAGIFVSYITLKSYDPWLANETDGWGGIRDGMQCYTRLQPNVSIAQVESVMPAYVKKHRPTSKNVHHYKLQPLKDIHFDARYGGAMEKQKLYILSIVGLFLIATACVNFVNLATAQALKRSKEVGVRKVLGSLRRQLFWQFIFETAIICAIGIVMAIGLASLILPYANSLFNMHMTLNPFTDYMLIYFIVSLGVVVTFLAGYYPALVLAKFQPVTALKGKVTQQNVGGFNVRRTLIVSQFAISQVLIIGVIVVVSQIRFARESDLGFDQQAIVMIGTGNDATPTSKEALKNEISRIRGVESVSLCFTAPASVDEWGNSIKFNNSSEEVNFRTSIKSADAEYASTFGLEFVAGRNLTPSDTVREMLVNEAMVRKLELESPEDAIGKVIVANGGHMVASIVGVLKDFHDRSFHEEISPILITTYTDDYENYAVKLNLSDAKSTLSAIEGVWSQQHPDQIFGYEFLDDSIAQFYESEETMLKLIQTFSLISIFIGCLGLYGLVSFTVTQKSKEIGIRKILGSSAGNILWIFWKEFAGLILIAFLIAGPLGWWLMRAWLQNFKFQVEISVWFFALAIGCSLLVALFTVSYQVMKAAFANPVKSLRME
jgi:putative ABC transport system permease protein